VILIGFVALRANGGLIVLPDQATVVAVVVLYIDDVHFIANESLIGLINDQMNKWFQMHDLRRGSFHLSMNIERSWEHNTINIHHQSYIRKILEK